MYKRGPSKLVIAIILIVISIGTFLLNGLTFSFIKDRVTNVSATVNGNKVIDKVKDENGEWVDKLDRNETPNEVISGEENGSTSSNNNTIDGDVYSGVIIDRDSFGTYMGTLDSIANGVEEADIEVYESTTLVNNNIDIHITKAIISEDTIDFEIQVLNNSDKEVTVSFDTFTFDTITTGDVIFLDNIPANSVKCFAKSFDSMMFDEYGINTAVIYTIEAATNVELIEDGDIIAPYDGTSITQFNVMRMDDSSFMSGEQHSDLIFNPEYELTCGNSVITFDGAVENYFGDEAYYRCVVQNTSFDDILTVFVDKVSIDGQEIDSLASCKVMKGARTYLNIPLGNTYENLDGKEISIEFTCCETATYDELGKESGYAVIELQKPDGIIG